MKVAASAYQDAQTELSNLITSRRKLESQLTENSAVKAEFDQLPNEVVDEDSPEVRKVYKLVANILIKQDTAEAKTNVNRRIEMLTAEQSKVDKKISTLQADLEKKKLELVHLQSQIQQKQGTPNTPSSGTPIAAV